MFNIAAVQPDQPSRPKRPFGRTVVLGIVGAPRSGSTVLARVLGQADGFFCAGEIRKLFSAAQRPGHPCGCGQPLVDCPIWGEVLQRVTTNGWTPDVALNLQFRVVRRRRAYLNSLAPKLAAGDSLRADFTALLGSTYRAIVDVTGASVIVDSSKKSDFALSASNVPGVDYRLVHLIRDPRGVAYSHFRRVRSGSLAAQSVDAVRQGASWLVDNAAAARVARSLANDSVTLRYEDLTRDPRGVLRQVTELCGSSFDFSNIVDGHRIRMTEETHAAHGNENRSDTGDVLLRSDDRWVDGLTRVQRGLVTAAAAPGLLTWGYAVTPGPEGRAFDESAGAD